MATHTTTKPKTLADALLEDKEITQKIYDEIRALERKTGRSMCRLLLENSYITDEQRIHSLELNFNFKLYDLGEDSVDITTTTLVPRRICAEHRIFPISRDEEGSLLLLMEDPTDRELIKVIQKKTNMRVQPVIARGTDLAILLRDGATAFATDFIEHTPIIPMTALTITERSKAFVLVRSLFSPVLIFTPAIAIAAYFFINTGAWRKLVHNNGVLNIGIGLVMGAGIWIIMVLYARSILLPSDHRS